MVIVDDCYFFGTLFSFSTFGGCILTRSVVGVALGVNCFVCGRLHVLLLFVCIFREAAAALKLEGNKLYKARNFDAVNAYPFIYLFPFCFP